MNKETIERDVVVPEFKFELLRPNYWKCSCGNWLGYDKRNFCEACGARLDWDKTK